jgi:hypothetical protein
MKFTIRDLLWLTVVVAVSVGWWANHPPRTVEVYPHDLVEICDPGQSVEVTILRDGYVAKSSDGRRVQAVKKTSE